MLIVLLVLIRCTPGGRLPKKLIIPWTIIRQERVSHLFYGILGKMILSLQFLKYLALSKNTFFLNDLENKIKFKFFFKELPKKRFSLKLLTFLARSKYIFFWWPWKKIRVKNILQNFQEKMFSLQLVKFLALSKKRKHLNDLEKNRSQNYFTKFQKNVFFCSLLNFSFLQNKNSQGPWPPWWTWPLA